MNKINLLWHVIHLKQQRFKVMMDLAIDLITKFREFYKERDQCNHDGQEPSVDREGGSESISNRSIYLDEKPSAL